MDLPLFREHPELAPPIQASRYRVGRKPLPVELRATYEAHRLSLRSEQWTNLFSLAEALNMRSRTGVNHGRFSWRTMMARLADAAPAIIESLAQKTTPEEKPMIFLVEALTEQTSEGAANG